MPAARRRRGGAAAPWSSQRLEVAAADGIAGGAARHLRRRGGHGGPQRAAQRLAARLALGITHHGVDGGSEGEAIGGAGGGRPALQRTDLHVTWTGKSAPGGGGNGVGIARLIEWIAADSERSARVRAARIASAESFADKARELNKFIKAKNFLGAALATSSLLVGCGSKDEEKTEATSNSTGLSTFLYVDVQKTITTNCLLSGCHTNSEIGSAAAFKTYGLEPDFSITV